MLPKIIGIDDGPIHASYNLEKKDKIYIGRKTWSIKYLVLAGNDSQNEDDIYNDTVGLPKLWAFANFGVCKSLKIAEKSTVFKHPSTGTKTILWTVKADFDSQIDLDQEQPPEAKTPTVRWSGETEEEVLERDPIEDIPVQTEPGEPIILTTPIILPVLEITRYEFYPFNPNIMLEYCHHTNSTTFWGAPPGSALMMPMDVEEEVIEQVKYVRVTYRIKFKIKKEGATLLEDTWKARVLHHGYKYRKNAGDEPITYQDKNGNPATINLAADGTKIPDGGTAEYLEFNRFTKANFNALNLGPF